MMAFKKILVPVDSSELSQDALTVAIDLAKTWGAQLTLVHVWELPVYAYAGMQHAPFDLLTPIRESAQAYLDQTIASVRSVLPNAAAILKNGSPAREILATIEQLAPDLVI